MNEVYLKLRDKGTIFRDPTQNIKITANVVVKAVRSKMVNDALQGGAIQMASEKDFNEYEGTKVAKPVRGKAAVAAPAPAPAPEAPAAPVATNPPAKQDPPAGGDGGDGGGTDPNAPKGEDKDKKPSGK